MMLGLVSATTVISPPTALAAMTSADCEAKWKRADTNGDSMINETVSASYFAYCRIMGKAMADDKLDKAQFMTDCRAGIYGQAAVGAGTPFEGANSFTETQAKDRAIAHGFVVRSGLNWCDPRV